MKSLHSKFLIILISGMLILAVAISVISVLYISKILDNDSDIITGSVANTETLRINEKLREVEFSVKTMENYITSTLTDVEKLSDEAFRKEYLAMAKDTFYIIAESCDGVVAYYFRPDPVLTDATAGFHIARTSSNANFVEFQPTSLSGWESAPYEEVCWFSEPRTTGSAIWLEPYHDKATNINMISYVIPIYKNHVFIGVVGVDYEFSNLCKMVKEISVYDNGFAYLGNPDNEEEIFYSPVDDHLLNRAHTDHGFAEEHKLLENGMTLVIHADYSDIQRDSYRIVNIIIIIVVVLLSGFTFIMYLLTRRKIIQPLKKITEAAELLAEGNTELRLESCYSRDEVGVLARSFEKTAEKLRGYMSYINTLAYKDALTGIKNRTAYNEMMAEIDVKIKIGYYEPFAMLSADINLLKETNDKYGHEIGNKLIIKAAKIICNVFKHSPVFRMGGDEFAVLLKGKDLENLDELLLELDEICRESALIVDGTEIPISIARAAEKFNPSLDVCVEDVYSRADKMMYEHKEKEKKRLQNNPSE